MIPPVRKILLTPGPATTTDTVKSAQVVSDICPRETEFSAVLRGISEDLARFVDRSGNAHAVLFAGSGTAAVESMITSLTGEGGLLVINNGAYGERIVHIAQTYGIRVTEYRSSPTAALDLDELEKLLLAAPSKSISHLAVVHHETTTGLLNDLTSLGRLCQRHGLELLVDAMSSFGAIPIDMDVMHLAALAASSNKNLQGMPGVSFVIARDTALEAARILKPRTFYLDLVAEHDYFAAHGQMRFTAPVQTLYALRQAIDEALAEGQESRFQRYSRSWQALIDGLEARGFASLVPRPLQSRLISAVEPISICGFRFDDMHDFLLARGFTVYPGKLSTRESFRVANIGDITYRDIEDFLSALDEYLALCNT